jgi:hypothetical protein
MALTAFTRNCGFSSAGRSAVPNLQKTQKTRMSGRRILCFQASVVLGTNGAKALKEKHMKRLAFQVRH